MHVYSVAVASHCHFFTSFSSDVRLQTLFRAIVGFRSCIPSFFAFFFHHLFLFFVLHKHSCLLVSSLAIVTTCNTSPCAGGILHITFSTPRLPYTSSTLKRWICVGSLFKIWPFIHIPALTIVGAAPAKQRLEPPAIGIVPPAIGIALCIVRFSQSRSFYLLHHVLSPPRYRLTGVLASSPCNRLRCPFPSFDFIAAKRTRLLPAIFGGVLPSVENSRLFSAPTAAAPTGAWY